MSWWDGWIDGRKRALCLLMWIGASTVTEPVLDRKKCMLQAMQGGVAMR